MNRDIFIKYTMNYQLSNNALSTKEINIFLYYILKYIIIFKSENKLMSIIFFFQLLFTLFKKPLYIFNSSILV